jgi:hypothetical protein
MDDELRFQNEIVLALVQVLVGSITHSVRAIAVATDLAGRSAVVHVAFSDVVDQDLLEDVVFELDALTGGELTIQAEPWVGPDWLSGWPGADKRLVYAAG